MLFIHPRRSFGVALLPSLSLSLSLTLSLSHLSISLFLKGRERERERERERKDRWRETTSDSFSRRERDDGGQREEDPVSLRGYVIPMIRRHVSRGRADTLTSDAVDARKM